MNEIKPKFFCYENVMGAFTVASHGSLQEEDGPEMLRMLITDKVAAEAYCRGLNWCWNIGMRPK
jgi:hypothetical protein